MKWYLFWMINPKEDPSTPFSHVIGNKYPLQHFGKHNIFKKTEIILVCNSLLCCMFIVLIWQISILHWLTAVFSRKESFQLNSYSNILLISAIFCECYLNKLGEIPRCDHTSVFIINIVISNISFFIAACIFHYISFSFLLMK